MAIVKLWTHFRLPVNCASGCFQSHALPQNNPEKTVHSCGEQERYSGCGEIVIRKAQAHMSQWHVRLSIRFPPRAKFVAVHHPLLRPDVSANFLASWTPSHDNLKHPKPSSTADFCVTTGCRTGCRRRFGLAMATKVTHWKVVLLVLGSHRSH